MRAGSRPKRIVRTQPWVTDEERQELIARYKAGESTVQLARAFTQEKRRITRHGVLYLLRAAGVKRRKSMPWRKMEPGEVRNGRAGIHEPPKKPRTFTFIRIP
jgi:hypothetical protein